MAVLENINYQPMIFAPSSTGNEGGFLVDPQKKSVDSFPQIFFSDGEPWHEANRYAFHRADGCGKDIKTIHREMNHLARYASWLEASGSHWLHFPNMKAERCLFRYRGALIEQRDSGLIAPSTTSQAMNSVVAFYRWASENGYVDASLKLFEDENKAIPFFDSNGFRRTINVIKSDLSIPNKEITGARLEDGLKPITQASAKTLMDYLSQHRNYELYLMTKIALQTGCRHETVTTLNIDALKKAYPHHSISSVMNVKVGPGSGVDTKHDVSGEVYFPKVLVYELIDYFNSAEAILRRSRASKEMQKYVFLTSRGNRYTSQTFGTLQHRLKEELIKDGNSEFGRYKFHQLRATFGTMLMRALLKVEGFTKENAVVFVRDAMLHSHESTTWKYIKFIEKEPIEEQFLDALWLIFTGPEKESSEIIQHLASGEMLHEDCIT